MLNPRLLGIIFLTATLLSCVAEVEPAHLGYMVDIPPDHVHTEFCGHYCHDSQWYYMQGHVPGPGCGHRYREGNWRCDHHR